MTVSETIGIMADSHGDADAISAAIRFFQKSGCRHMIHLGDICDSVACDRADECVALLRTHAVLAVKGNNDHAVVKNRTLRQDGRLSGETMAYLASLPLQVEMFGALFVHSRPFADTLGLAAMTGDIGKAETDRFLEQYPGGRLFRGHGHSPLAVRLPDTRHPAVCPAPGDRLRLDGRQGWVVTCGALYKGLCMTWAPRADVIISHRLVPGA
jgi:predicted phosphodiesterase